MRTCLHRFLGDCKGCERDYNLERHPNNYDCSSYYEINLVMYQVENKEKGDGKLKGGLKFFVSKVLNPDSSSKELLRKLM